jgi:transcriptional regulator with XRE-family HTH domain
MTGPELRALRDAHDLTQYELGELLGYHWKHISRLERGAEGVQVTERCAKLLNLLFQEKSEKKGAETIVNELTPQNVVLYS